MRIKSEEKEKAKEYDGNVLRDKPFELGLCVCTRKDITGANRDKERDEKRKGKEYGFQAKWVAKGKGMDSIRRPYSQRGEIMVKLAKVSSKGYLKGTKNPKARANSRLCSNSRSRLFIIITRAKVWLHFH